MLYRDVVVRTVAAACRLVGDPPDDAHDIDVDDQDAFDLANRFDAEVVSAFSEVFNNICLHSYGNGRGVGEVEIEIETTEQSVSIRMVDDGEPFDISEVPSPDLDAMPEGGLGVFIIRSFVDEFEYNPGPPNEWILKKSRAPEDKQSERAAASE